MARNSNTLEQRLTKVERELAELKAAVKQQEPRKSTIPWWQQIDGDFKDDPVFAEIIRLGAQIRRADRKGRR